MKRTGLSLALTLVVLVVFVPPAWAAPPAQDAVGGMDKFSEVIAALGLFAAMMAVLALGAEVVIDGVKFVLGFKSKPTSLEAIKQFSAQLPGQLNDLGLTDEASARVQKLALDLQQTLKPAADLQESLRAACAGDLHAIFDLATRLAGSQNIAAAQAEIARNLDAGLQMFLASLKIPPEQSSAIIAGAVSCVKAVSPGGDPQELVKRLLEGCQKAAPAIVQAWLQGQEQELTLGGRQAVRQSFESAVLPRLKSLGLLDADIEAIRAQVDKILDKLNTQADLYLASVQDLMQAVENRRHNIQSPARKLWRELRKMPVLGYGIKWPNAQNKSKGEALNNWLNAVGYKDGVGLLTWPEALFNGLAHRQPPLGDLNKVPPVPALTAKNLAGYLLDSEARHQDEETSRVRALRVVSVVVGIYLAYLLQVNAIDILARSSSLFRFLTEINNSVVTTEMVKGWLNPPWLLALLHAPSVFVIPGNMQLNAGIILSGLAASAGSAFWHDQLGRLQVAKKAAEQVKETVQSLQQAAPQG